MKHLYCFDFDGTLTTSDSMIAFLRYAVGTPTMLFAFLLYSPLLVLMKLHLFSNGRAKELVLGFCFKGWTEEEFSHKAELFASEHKHILRPATLEILKKAVREGADVMVVSASLVTWVRPFFSDIPGVKVIGTEMQVRDGRLTGRLSTPNCYGKEKVNRILREYPDREKYHLHAFGDSRGDREMFAFANEATLVK